MPSSEEHGFDIPVVPEKKINMTNLILSLQDMCRALLILFVIPSLGLDQEKEHTVVWWLIFNCHLDTAKNPRG